MRCSDDITLCSIATPPETEDDSMITPDFVQPTFQLEEPAAAEEQSQNTELSDEQKLGKMVKLSLFVTPLFLLSINSRLQPRSTTMKACGC